MPGTPQGAEKSRQKLVEKFGKDAAKIVGARGGRVSSDAKKAAARLREQKKREKRAQNDTSN